MKESQLHFALKILFYGLFTASTFISFYSWGAAKRSSISKTCPWHFSVGSLSDCSYVFLLSPLFRVNSGRQDLGIALKVLSYQSLAALSLSEDLNKWKEMHQFCLKRKSKDNLEHTVG